MNLELSCGRLYTGFYKAVTPYRSSPWLYTCPPSLPWCGAHNDPLPSNRLVSSCHAKCIQPDPMRHRYAEGELLKGESVCIDRCTAKFFEVNKVVGEKMQTMGQTAQATGGFGR